MPKLSVYVNDELWDRAKSAMPGSKNSQIVQEALQRLTEKASYRPEYAQEPPPGANAQVESVRQRLAMEAKQRYQGGYKRGLELAGQLDWGLIEDLAYLQWNVSSWIERLRRQGLDAEAETTEEIVGDSDELRYFGIETWSKSAYREGLADALKHVWTAVTGAESRDAS